MSAPRTLSLAALNHLLEGHRWARDKLARHVGRCAEITVAPLTLRFVVEGDGRVVAAPEDATPEAVVSLPPAALLRHLATGEADTADLATDGDAAFALDIATVLRGLRWDAEEDLSRMVGDIAAHRLASVGKALLSWQARAALSLGQSLAEYWTEEAPLLARPADLAAFSREVDEMRDAVERAEKRLERLVGGAG